MSDATPTKPGGPPGNGDTGQFPLYTPTPVPTDPRKVLGMDLGDWTRIIIKYGVGIAVVAYLWTTTVNSEIRDRPTRSEMKTATENILKATVDVIKTHSIVPHPVTDKRIDKLEGEQKKIRESQIRQETIDIQQSKTLNEIRKDVRTIRRRGR